MGIIAACQDLHASLAALREALLALRVTIREDTPLGGDLMIVDMLGDAVDDVLGWLEEALTNGSHALLSIEQRDLSGMLQSLHSCHERLDRIERSFVMELLPYERVAELVRLERKRSGEWRGWARSVRYTLNSCQEPLFDTSRALRSCWQEIVEHVGTPLIAMPPIPDKPNLLMPGGNGEEQQVLSRL